MNVKKQIIDQSAHFLGGALLAIITIALIGPSILAVIVAGIFGFAREVWQHQTLPRGAGSWTDILFWTLGGAFVGALHNGVIQ